MECQQAFVFWWLNCSSKEGDALFCQHVAQEILSASGQARGTTASIGKAVPMPIATHTSVTQASPQKVQSPAQKGFAA